MSETVKVLIVNVILNLSVIAILITVIMMNNRLRKDFSEKISKLKEKSLELITSDDVTSEQRTAIEDLIKKKVSKVRSLFGFQVMNWIFLWFCVINLWIAIFSAVSAF